MKKVISNLAIALLAITIGCAGEKQSSDDLIIVDVKKSYSSKKELILQDFMDVEYIALETTDEFLNQGFVMDIGKEVILIKNIINDGYIFVYDRKGNCLRKFNRIGQGPEDYTFILCIALDEDNNEMFVNDQMSRKIVVYDLYGKFKRSFKHKEGSGSLFYTFIFNYDKDNLICYDQFNEEIGFVLISKRDGRVTKEINIPFKEKKLLLQRSSRYYAGPGQYPTIIPFADNWILAEISSDTIYTLLQDYRLIPFVVRIPSIQTMDPGIFLVLRSLTERYYFMETIKNVYDFETGRGFPRTFMMYDKQENTFFGYNVYNGDYSSKQEIYMNALRPVNHEIESWQSIEAYQLVEAYKKGVLKDGKLKEIASKLDVEDNPVIMLIKHKK